MGIVSLTEALDLTTPDGRPMVGSTGVFAESCAVRRAAYSLMERLCMRTIC